MTIMRLLIAEDDPTSRLMLAAVLEKEGYEVVQTTDGRQALESLRGADAPVLAILDWMMPDLDGLDVVRRVRESNPGVPPYLIMLTTRDTSSDLVTALRAGANDYLTKPFNPAELLARVAVGIRMVDLQNELAKRIRDLQRALNEIKTLRGIVPICAHCKKVRDDTGFWQQVEVYVRDHTEAQFSHGLCPDCIKNLYPELHEGQAEPSE